MFPNFFYEGTPEILVHIPRNPNLWRRVQAIKNMSKVESAIQLLLNYCQETLFIKSWHIYQRILREKRRNIFPVFFCLIFKYRSIKSQRLLQYWQLLDTNSRDISRDIWNCSWNFEILFIYSTISCAAPDVLRNLVGRHCFHILANSFFSIHTATERRIFWVSESEEYPGKCRYTTIN
jgi:hypothetical protein